MQLRITLSFFAIAWLKVVISKPSLRLLLLVIKLLPRNMLIAKEIITFMLKASLYLF